MNENHFDLNSEDNPLLLEDASEVDATEDYEITEEVANDTDISESEESGTKTEPSKKRVRKKKTTDPDSQEIDLQSTSPTPKLSRDEKKVLTVLTHENLETDSYQEATLWREIVTARKHGKLLTGTLDGVERNSMGIPVGIVYYNGFRVVIPVSHLIHITDKQNDFETMDSASRQERLAYAMIGSEIDFLLRGINSKERTAVASRLDAMARKRRNYYLRPAKSGNPMVFPGRVVQSRIVAVGTKSVRFETFGVEHTVTTQDLTYDNIGNAKDYYDVGQKLLLKVIEFQVENDDVVNLVVDGKCLTTNTALKALDRCVVQGKYAGKITDVYQGILFVKLNNGANGIAYTCFDRKVPGRGDEVTFVVTEIDREKCSVAGIITRILRQNI